MEALVLVRPDLERDTSHQRNGREQQRCGYGGVPCRRRDRVQRTDEM